MKDKINKIYLYAYQNRLNFIQANGLDEELELFKSIFMTPEEFSEMNVEAAEAFEYLIDLLAYY